MSPVHTNLGPGSQSARRLSNKSIQRLSSKVEKEKLTRNFREYPTDIYCGFLDPSVDTCFLHVSVVLREPRDGLCN